MGRTPERGVLVIGPGAIGTIVAARLANQGSAVTMACRTRESADEINRLGIEAKDPRGGKVAARVAALAAPQALERPPGLVVLATKCGDAATALRSWGPYLPDDSVVVAMQNGILGDKLAPLSGGRLVECVVAFPATLTATGRSTQTGPGGFILGEWTKASERGPPSLRVRGTALVLSRVAPVKVSQNLRGAKWTKLIVNSAITTLGAATNADLGELLELERARLAFLAVATEGYRVGRSLGVAFEPIQGFRPGIVALPSPASRWSLA